MQRYFLELQYDGTYYSGWQKQANAITVQEVIQSKFNQLNADQPIEILGCGRTDAGVHASYFVAHFDWDLKFSPLDLHFRLNKMLPDDISVLNCKQVKQEAHARFDAEERTYRYYIHPSKNAFINRYSYYLPQKINIDTMNKAAEFLLGKQDFKCFSKSKTDVNNYICEIQHAQWEKAEYGWYFEITANRFLRNMVRAIVGSLLDINDKDLAPESIQKVIASKDRQKAGESVPACGLFLVDVKYPSNIYIE